MAKQTLCLGCAHIYYVANEKGRFLTCPRCGFKVGRGRYKKIINFSYEAVRYGFDYRIAYQNLEDGSDGEERKTVYCLAEPE